MIQSPYSLSEIQQRLSETGICFRVGPFIVNVTSDIPAVAEGLWRFYSEYPRAGEDGYADYHIRLFQAGGLRRWFRPQVLFSMDGRQPFKPMPLAQAFPLFEWTFNWCIANHSHQYLIFHAAVVEKNGRAAILAAPSGSGKSTLCAALVTHGWRLFSDELALVDLASGDLISFPRPVGLKNASIDIMRKYSPDAVIGPATSDTRKGTVAHMKASADSILRAAEPARPAWIVFPKYIIGSNVSLSPVKKTATALSLIRNSFNYHLLGARGFHVLTDLIDNSDCFEFTYSQLDDAIAAFNTFKQPRP